MKNMFSDRVPSTGLAVAGEAVPDGNSAPTAPHGAIEQHPGGLPHHVANRVRFELRVAHYRLVHGPHADGR